MEIMEGWVKRGQKVVIYGPEGIGKSTFLSKFPSPLFIDTEGSTLGMNLRRFKDRPSTWTMLKEQVQYVLDHKDCCKTLCIDTADWAERLCIAEVCAKKQVNGIEDFGYGKGYTYVSEEFGRLLNLLEDVADAGVNVALSAHAIMRKFEQPEAMGAYDRWELKLSKQCAPMLKEWADALLFANYKITVVKTKDETRKATGGERVMYTTHHPCWDAKNRWGLPDELPFRFEFIADYVHINGPSTVAAEVPKPEPKQAAPENAADPIAQLPESTAELPKAVADLMKGSGITEADIRQVVFDRGYFPYEMPISAYPDEFIQGWLVPFFPKVVELVKTNGVPFK